MKTFAACLWLVISSCTCNLQDPNYLKLIEHTIEEHLHFHCDHKHHEHHDIHSQPKDSKPFIAPKTKSIPPCCPHGQGSSCSIRRCDSEDSDSEDSDSEDSEDSDSEDSEDSEDSDSNSSVSF